VCERHDLWIVCDEVYADLVYGQPFVSPFDHPVLRERTITTASISKSHALPGLRVGWVAGPAEAMERVTLLTETMLFGGQPFLADALAEALDGEHPEVAALKGTFEARGHVVADTLAGSPACSTRVPEGGMFLMVDVRPTGLTGEQFAWRLLDEHHVVVMPGESFGSRGAGHVRIALTADAAVLRSACTILRGLAESLVAEQAAQASA
jgi:arginine:pyruvate transaminase